MEPLPRSTEVRGCLDWGILSLSTMNLTCVQINLNRAELAQTELLANLNRDKDTLVFIQEPYTFKNKLVRLPKGYNCFPTKLTERPRAALYVRKNNKFAELNALTTRDLSLIHI